MITRDALLYLGCLYTGGIALVIEAHAIASASWGELLASLIMALLP